MDQLQPLKPLLQNAVTSNPVFLLLIGQLDTLFVFMYGQTPALQKEIALNFARTVLLWIGYAERAAAKTASPYDDAVVSELHQACQQIVANG